ncbi:Hypothetical protein A7982_02794 [Minicystis rosea]|nr:Hypothetical protein A7982_02794 [Minicystis rosea]
MGGPEARGVDRILAESFWRSSSKPNGAPAPASLARVCTLPVRRP